LYRRHFGSFRRCFHHYFGKTSVSVQPL
jgi:hypothetical protein